MNPYILYQDENIVAVNKPSGWLVHRSWLDKNEQKILMLRVRDEIGQHVFTVHRLDKPTSGIVLMALNPEMARELSKAFEENRVNKKYHAIVRGFVTQSGEINYPLTIVRDKIADKFSMHDKAPQEALTRYKPLDYFEVPIANEKHSSTRYTLIELEPVTGRKHQLRRHMSHIRHPIIGDSAHGDLKKNRQFAKFFNVKRLMLHATHISFNNPETQNKIEVNAPLSSDDEFNELIEKLKQFKIHKSDENE